MKSLMRAALIWTLSLLLGVEPAVLAATKGVNQDIKTWLEQSGITQRSMTLREFYSKNLAYLPADVRAQIEPFVNEFPNYELPKVDVNKVTGPNGEEVYQLQAVKDGKAISMSLTGANANFMKLNGVNFAVNDLMDVRAAAVKAGVPAKEAAQYFSKRTLASLGPMTLQRALKLGPAQRKQYVKQLRQLLESIEAVQATGLGIKTSAVMESKEDFFAQIFFGAESIADDGGKDCVAAGYEAKVAWNKNRLPQAGWTCGSDGGGGVAPAYRGEKCAVNQYQCNPVLFGGNAPCVDAGRDTTKTCSEKVQNGRVDIPDTATERKKFFELKDSALAQGKKLQAICASANYEKSGLTGDQKYTCGNLDARVSEIESWDCNQGNYDKHTNLKKICESTPNPGQPGQPGPGNPGNTDPSQPADTRIWCDKLPLDMSQQENSCVKGTVANSSCLVHAPGNDDPTAQSAYKCFCDNGGKITAKMACDGGSQASTGSDHDSTGRKSKKKSKLLSWLLIGGAVIGGVFLLHWLTKKAFKTAYSNVDPTTIDPPITVPPLPTTLPPPIPVAPAGAH